MDDLLPRMRLRADFEALPPGPTPTPCLEPTPRNGGPELPVYDPIGQARQNPRSRAWAVKATCWDCVGAGTDPHPRREIGECRAKGCPLYPVRPYQKEAQGHRYLRRAINARCRRCVGPDPNPAARIRECAITACPLHGLRPCQRRAQS